MKYVAASRLTLLSADMLDVEVEDKEAVFMSILYDRDELGVAIYNALTTSLKTLQIQIIDPQELEEILERLYTQFEVNYVLISSRNASMNGMLRMVKKIDEKNQTETGISIRKIFQKIRQADKRGTFIAFSFHKGSQLIAHVQIGDASTESRKHRARSSRQETYGYLASFFDFESIQLIRATGALLLYLSAEKIGNQLDDVESVYFATVEQVALDGFMYIDKTTLQSLQIFNHGSGRAKEGFSLFGLLNRTVTKSGGSMLRHWMLTPLVNSAQINERLSSVAFFSNSENDEFRQLLVFLLLTKMNI
ncbi:hypothetical protein PsorP6_013706 [Peronosclerospora sorghi]|uniref:Uncharacterized protein n=1 Tax=Peronosclerospora sorghi TaxID=230839 RepID=A0ACC0VH35_9STRA|nr:hypothetical protein PsorP6_013706 [Peronosclerospora sorghi]